MRISRSFINFATVFCMALLPICLFSCKGRTMDNFEPTGDTVEVVIMQNPNVDSNN